MEIRNIQFWYEKGQLPSLTSTQLFFFDEVHIQQFSGTPTTSTFNEHNIRFPRDEEGNSDVKSWNYETKNQPKKVTFKYEQ